ncbi:MAG: hypothetical protein SFU85_04990 [Candidatus Methylacidiphilales bacterium]|nr:hypothetical protein [Candidatus Methylacidiphilales bacterium]
MSGIPLAGLALCVYFCYSNLYGQGRPGEANQDTAVLESTPSATAEDLANEPTRVKVDWSQATGASSTRSFSVALFSAFNPEEAAKPAYLENLRYMGLGIFRLHHAGLMADSKVKPNGWIDLANRAWDRDKIQRALTALDSLPGERIINISEWPEWMDANKDRFLDEDQKAAFARLCADLVQIINVEQKRGFSFEITNELDGLYWLNLRKKGQPDRLEELAAIYNACAAAMREVDPLVRLGGPALTRPDSLEDIRRFVRLTKGHLDFLSFHMYASGSMQDADRAVFAKTDTMARHVKELADLVAAESPERKIELHCNEFNISWTWKTRDQRMTNIKGAVFDALALIAMKQAGLDVACAWNERDGVYGKMDDQEKLRPPAHVYHFMNSLMIGTLHPTVASRPARVRAMAASAGKRATLMLVNWSADPQKTDLSGALPESVTELQRVDLCGETPVVSLWNKTREITLPGLSVTWLSFDR